MLKNILTKLQTDGLASALMAIRKSLFKSKEGGEFEKMLANNDIKDRFSAIYEHNLWRSNESLSGEGSEVQYTEPLRKWLLENLPKLDIDVLVDAPCGDYNWMQLVVPEVNLQYIGLDIVPSIIDRNKQLYERNGISFEIANICTDKIPACDLVMVRDCLFHLSHTDIDNFFRNLESTDYKYLLTTTHITNDGFVNNDIATGDFRIIDLFSEPYNFSKSDVLAHITDNPEGFSIPREMILIEKKNVPTRLTVSEH